MRYYEKIGLLKPTYIDPETKYRYYSPEQLSELDVILLCIKLGIPLKDLSKYIDEQGQLSGRKLFEDGKVIAERQMAEIRLGLKKTEYTLRYMDANRKYENRDGLYTRHIGSRFMLTREYIGDIMDIERVELEFSKLFDTVQSRGFTSVLPSGIILRFSNGNPVYTLYFELLDEGCSGADIFSIQEGDFLCLQFGADTKKDPLAMIKENYQQIEKGTYFIISNMFLSKFQFRTYRTEIQLPIHTEV